MSDTKRFGGVRDGARVWETDTNWWRGDRFKPALRRIRDRVVFDDVSAMGTKRENNRRRRAADRVVLREAVSEAEAERSIEMVEPAEGKAAEGAARHPAGMSGDRGK